MSNLREKLIKKGFAVDRLRFSEERKVFEMIVNGKSTDEKAELLSDPIGKSSSPVKIGRGLIYSNDFQKCLNLGKNILKYDFPPFTISYKDKEKEAEPINAKDKTELLDIFMRDGKKGITIQRYKGLGEMNPDQLWETTMNPEKRNIFKVKVEDVVDTDEILPSLWVRLWNPAVSLSRPMPWQSARWIFRFN